VFYPAHWSWEEDQPFALAQVDVKDVLDKGGIREEGVGSLAQAEAASVPVNIPRREPQAAVPCVESSAYLNQWLMFYGWGYVMAAGIRD